MRGDHFSLERLKIENPDQGLVIDRNRPLIPGETHLEPQRIIHVTRQCEGTDEKWLGSSPTGMDRMSAICGQHQKRGVTVFVIDTVPIIIGIVDSER